MNRPSRRTAPNRREVIRAAALSVIAAHLPLMRAFASSPRDAPRPGAGASLPLLRLSLKAARLEEQARFYRETLALPVVEEGPDGVAFRAGWTTLRFEPADPVTPDPVYHFAFNIPENRFDEALAWARERFPIARSSDGREVYHFARWDAHAFYFMDPAGNVCEFIARHTLRNATDRPFDSRDIGEVSEIGLITDDVPALVDRTREVLGAEPYLGHRSDTFTAVGDAEGLFIVVERGREWLGSPIKADAFPARITTRGAPEVLRPYDGLPYEIERES